MFVLNFIGSAVFTQMAVYVLIILLLLMAGIALYLYLKYQKQQKIATSLIDDRETALTELERLKDELFESRQKAGESDRLKSAFLLNMSHELRTPLHAIMGFAGLIANPLAEESEKISYANIINRNVDSLLEIINDIFDISQAEAGITTVNLDALNVNEMLNALQTRINLEKMNDGKPDIIVKLSKANKDSSFEIETDSYKMRRAMSHLTDNALKYTNDGYIEIGYQFGESGTIDFFVKDDGIGFPVEKLDVLLSQFRQGDETPTRQYGGLGLGLAVAQKFVALINGRLWAESEPGEGATFWISLPMKSANVEV